MNQAVKKICFAIVFLLFLLFPLFSETDELQDLPFEEDELLSNEITEKEHEDIDSLYLLEDQLAEEDNYLDEESIFFEASPLIIEAAPFTGPRSFNDIFPGLTQEQIEFVYSNEGLRYSFEKVGTPVIVPNPDSKLDLLSSVMSKRPSFIIQALALVPNYRRELDLLDIYNALGNISNIKNHTFVYNDRSYRVFSETTRLQSARDRTPIPDPSPADTLPYSDTMYLRFTDAGFGDLFIRGDVSPSLYGITYNLTNFRDVRMSFIPIIKAERVSIIIYLEPVKEGILIYSMSGFYLPALIAYSANLTPSINRRISVLQNWITYSLRKQEDTAQIQW